MATEFSTAPAISQPAPYQHHAYRKSAQYSQMGPRSGSNTPVNASPTSPRSASHLPLHAHHAPPIRPLKTPIYVPAALRRTERPGSRSPPKQDSVMEPSSSSWGTSSVPGQGAGEGNPTPITRIATENIQGVYNDAPLSPITGPITRNHWQPDSSASVCTASACQSPFGFFHRRHHCRKCGGIFCWQHSQKQVKLNEHALFHPDGEWQRACDRCHSQFREWEKMHSSRTNSESSGSTGAGAVQINMPPAKRPEAQRVGSLATSFSGNWNWSTF